MTALACDCERSVYVHVDVWPNVFKSTVNVHAAVVIKAQEAGGETDGEVRL